MRQALQQTCSGLWTHATEADGECDQLLKLQQGL